MLLGGVDFYIEGNADLDVFHQKTKTVIDVGLCIP